MKVKRMNRCLFSNKRELSVKWRHALLHCVLFATLLAGCKTVASQGGGKALVVSSVEELYAAASACRPGDNILLNDGTYKDVKLVITNSGTAEKRIRVGAKNPGKVLFTGDAKLELRGEYLIVDGLYFKDGSRNPEQWKPHGPGLVAIYGSHNRITGCVFDAFDDANSAWITTSLTKEGKVPQHCRIDHCSFINKLTFDQVINLNNAFAPIKDSTAVAGPPMYHRVDHNFFSNPPKPGNAGGGIRVGYFRYDLGRCLIDSNLFMHQDSEAEIVTSKSRENVYYANTVLNCRGTLNFRHGDHQVAINNFFIGTDSAFEYGGMFVWGSRHVIGANYYGLPRTLTSRGNAALYLNPGAPGTEHALAFDITVVNNAFVNNGGYAVHFNPLDRQRKKQYAENGWIFQTPHDIRFVNNFFYSSPCSAYSFFRDDYSGDRGIAWQNNVASGCPLGKEVTSGISTATCKLQKTEIYQPSWCKGYRYASIKNLPPIEGISLDFNSLISRGISGRPLTIDQVGPAWFKEVPVYAKTGVLPNDLKARQKDIIEKRGSTD